MLETLTKDLLPKSYKTFLEYFGQDNGGLNIAYDGTTCISEIIRFYSHYVITGKEKIPDNFLLIGLGEPPAEDVYLERLNVGERVFLSQEGSLLTLYADSLEQLLYRLAFAIYPMNTLPISRFYTNNDISNQKEYASEIASNLGINKLWFSDSIEFCGECSDTAIIINQYENHGLAIRISALNEMAIEKISIPLTLMFNLVQQPS